jgi:hypothetical protein
VNSLSEVAVSAMPDGIASVASIHGRRETARDHVAIRPPDPRIIRSTIFADSSIEERWSNLIVSYDSYRRSARKGIVVRRLLKLRGSGTMGDC